MTLDVQLLVMAAKNAELIIALERIAMRHKLDARAAASMKSIAIKALKSAGINTKPCK